MVSDIYYFLMNAAPGGELAKMALPLALGMVAFYLLLVRPEQKKRKEHESWLKTLKKGDEIITNGGLIAKVVGISDLFVTLEPQEKVRIKFLLSGIAGRSPLQKNDSKNDSKEDAKSS